MKFFTGLVFLSLFCLMACNNQPSSEEDNVKTTPLISYQVVTAYPHDTSSFTQGLAFYEGSLLEGTGLTGKSKLRQIDLATGKAVKELPLEKDFFGEGITVLNDSIYQLTWQNHLVFIYSAKDFKKLAQLPLKSEGWGITNDGKQLIVSDGSSNLYFYRPGNFELLRVLAVTENGAPAVNLNELEFINGYVYANQWQYNYILKIDPQTGEVLAKIDLSDLVAQVKAKEPQADVLNGIAYNPQNGKVYVTGKNWSQIYEISFNL